MLLYDSNEGENVICPYSKVKHLIINRHSSVNVDTLVSFSEMNESKNLTIAIDSEPNRTLVNGKQDIVLGLIQFASVSTDHFEIYPGFLIEFPPSDNRVLPALNNIFSHSILYFYDISMDLVLMEDSGIIIPYENIIDLQTLQLFKSRKDKHIFLTRAMGLVGFLKKNIELLRENSSNWTTRVDLETIISDSDEKKGSNNYGLRQLLFDLKFKGVDIPMQLKSDYIYCSTDICLTALASLICYLRNEMETASLLTKTKIEEINQIRQNCERIHAAPIKFKRAYFKKNLIYKIYRSPPIEVDPTVLSNDIDQSSCDAKLLGLYNHYYDIFEAQSAIQIVQTQLFQEWTNSSIDISDEVETKLDVHIESIHRLVQDGKLYSKILKHGVNEGYLV